MSKLKRSLAVSILFVFVFSLCVIALPQGKVMANGYAWPMYRHDPQHTGQSPYIGAQTNNVKWTFKTGKEIGSSAAIGSGGTIYIGSWDKNLYAINPDGTLKWSYSTGNAIASSPAISSDGSTVYVGSYDGKLYAFNSFNGALKWSYTTGGGVFSSPVIGSDGTIYVGSLDGKLYVIQDNGDHCTFKWSFQTGGPIYSSPAIGSDGTIYVGSMDCNLYAINPDGSLKWSYTTGGAIESSPAVLRSQYTLDSYSAAKTQGLNSYNYSHDTIYIGSNDGRLYAIEDTFAYLLTTTGYKLCSTKVNTVANVGDIGYLKWSFQTGGPIYSSPAIGSDGTIYFGSKDGYLYAVKDNEFLEPGSLNPKLFAVNQSEFYTLKWKYEIGECDWSSPAIGSDGTIYIGSYGNNTIYAVNSNGTLKWSYQTGGPINSSASIGSDGTVYIGSSDYKVYAFAQNFTITASAGFGGTISPSGPVTVPYSGSQSFTIKANSGYFIYRILVDGNPILFNNSLEYTYTFTNVTANHRIEAQFMKQLDLTPPSLTLPTINGVNLDMPNSLLQINTPTLTFTVQASDESVIARMVVKVNGVTQIDKNNLDPTITLNEGMNTVEVTVYDTYGNYTTKSFKVLKDTEGPTIILPSDLPQTVSSNTFTLKGAVIDSASGISTLMVNNHSIAVTLDGNFELQLTLTQGTNTITIEAVDKLGNKTTKTVTLSYNTSQSKSYIITLKVGDPHITINGIQKNIDAQGSKPIIKNERTLVPIRVIIESLGGTVEWDNTQKKVTITLGYNTIELWIGNPIAKVNGVDTPIDSTNSKVVPEIINGRTYLPLRFISENLGASVDWDSKTQTITIYYF